VVFFCPTVFVIGGRFLYFLGDACLTGFILSPADAGGLFFVGGGFYILYNIMYKPARRRAGGLFECLGGAFWRINVL